MEGKIVIVTGGNSGIGLATVRGLAQLKATVIMAVRDVAKGQAARNAIVEQTGNPRVEVMELDLASTASIKKFAKEFQSKHQRLDVLVNNAGMWTRVRSTTKEGFESTFGVNHL